MVDPSDANRPSRRPADWAPLAVVLLALAVMRWKVHDRLPVPRWNDLAGSLAFELAVVGCAALLAGRGRAGRLVAGVSVAVLLLLDAANTAFLLKMGTYAQSYVLEALTVGEMSGALLAELGVVGWTALAVAFWLAVAFGRPGSPEHARGYVVVGAWAVIVAWSAIAAVQSLRYAHRSPVSAQSPVLWFLAGSSPSDSGTALPPGEPRVEDWSPPGGLRPEWSGLAPALGDSVVVVVLESVRASAVWPVAPRENSPNLAALASTAVTFTRAYAHDPRSIKALEALVLGVFPSPTWRAMTWDTPDVALDSVPARWRRAGLATAFLEDADLAFDNHGALLRDRGFDLVGGKELVRPLSNGRGDFGLVTAFERFLDANAGRPVGALLWPVKTHTPYVVPGGVGEPGSFAAYVEAVKHVDAVVGAIVAALEARGRRDSTWLVIVGDHGESFGEHPESGLAHGRWLFEESVRVPLMVVHPSLSPGHRDDTVVQLKDVAATSAWLADRGSPGLNVGRSVFHEARGRSAYLCGAMGGLRLAIVEGDLKFHFARAEQGGDDFRVYDIRADPAELRNLWNPQHPVHAALAMRTFGWARTWESRWREVQASPLSRDPRWVGRHLAAPFDVPSPP